MRSVAVVFPASMCAMIPMFRQRFRATVRATAVSSLRALIARGSKAVLQLQTLGAQVRIFGPGKPQLFGCPTLAASLFLRLGWETAPTSGSEQRPCWRSEEHTSELQSLK